MNRRLNNLGKTIPSKYSRTYTEYNNPYQVTNSYNECYQVAQAIVVECEKEIRHIFKDLEEGMSIEDLKKKYL